MQTLKTILALIGIFIAIPFIYWSWTSDAMNPPKPEVFQAEKDRSTARFVCREALKQALHDPDSAEFGQYYSWPAGLMEDDDSIMLVQPEIRATNGFGAKVLTQFECRFAVAPEGGVTFLSVREI